MTPQEIDKTFSRLQFDDKLSLYTLIRSGLAGSFHSEYVALGQIQPKKGGNFKCPNMAQHKKADQHPSMSVNDYTGDFRCHGCGYKGGFYKFYQDNCQGANGEYHSRYIQRLGLEESLNRSGIALRKEAAKAQETYEKWLTENGQGEKTLESQDPLDVAEYDKYVDNLLANRESLTYLYETRHITPETIDECRIGLKFDNVTFTFPMFDLQQRLMNYKEYNPRTGRRKWMWIQGRPAMPSPIMALSQPKIYFFEGEPDMYCARGFGLNGFTAGSATSLQSLRLVLGDKFADTFQHKEIVLVLDDDSAGDKAAADLVTELYPIAAQIKILSLRKTPDRPWGLDPEVLNDKGKRAEKDFTDFMRKSGMNDLAVQRFLAIEQQTPAYVFNPTRAIQEVIKVSISEATQGRYFDPNGTKKLEIVAVPVGISSSPYNMATAATVDCPACQSENNEQKWCQMCQVPKMLDKRGDTETMKISLELVCGNPRFEKVLGKTNTWLRRLRVDDMMTLIETDRANYLKALKKFIGIPATCPMVDMYTSEFKPVCKVTLTPDVKEAGHFDDDQQNAILSAYTYDFTPTANVAYRFHGVMGTHHRDMSSIFFADKIEPVSTSISGFRMTEDTDNILKLFQPKHGESVTDCLNRRHDAFCSAIGMVDRRDLMAVCDIAFFSCTEIRHKKFAGSDGRGFVEAAVIGTTRTGKSHIAQFLLKQYGVGTRLQCGPTVSQAGMLGGITKRNGNSIAWGVIPMNDRGIVVLDEAQELPETTITAMNSVRATGIMTLDKNDEHGSARARTRKIWLSNNRKAVVGTSTTDPGLDGFQALMEVYQAEAAITRFDIAIATDAIKDIIPEFKQLSSDYSPYACQTHIRWMFSRTPEQIIFTPECEAKIFETSSRMQKDFHPKTLLVNAEMHVKLARMAVSIAAMTYCHGDTGDANLVVPQPEHVDFVEAILRRCYSSIEFDLIGRSDVCFSASTLGDMRFLEYALKYTNPDLLLRTPELSKDSLKGMFSDYIMSVVKGYSYAVDALTDERKVTGINNSNDVVEKFVNALSSRNFLNRGRYGYTLTKMGQRWLKEYNRNRGSQPESDYLKVDFNKPPIVVVAGPAETCVAFEQAVQSQIRS